MRFGDVKLMLRKYNVDFKDVFAWRGILKPVKQDVKFNHASSVSGLEVGRKLGYSSLASKVLMLRLKFRYASRGAN